MRPVAFDFRKLWCKPIQFRCLSAIPLPSKGPRMTLSSLSRATLLAGVGLASLASAPVYANENADTQQSNSDSTSSQSSGQRDDTES